MDFSQIAIFGAASVAAFFAAKFAVKGDTRVEDRRRQATKLSAWCQQNGLPGVSGLLAEYAIGNYSGCLYAMQQLNDVITDQAQSKAAIDNFLRVQLDARLADTDAKAALVQYIEKKLGVKLTATPVEVKPE